MLKFIALIVSLAATVLAIRVLLGIVDSWYAHIALIEMCLAIIIMQKGGANG